MKKSNLLFTFIFLFFALILSAQPNYAEDIAPIIYDNCTTCHRDGEIGPMSLTNYDEVAAWAGMIQYVTEIKYMPPWPPDQKYSSFIGERGLSDDEIQLLKDWVAAGTPQGDPNLEPELPDFPTGSQLGTPDLVLEMAESHFIEGDLEDDYRVFVLPTGLTEDIEIAAVEFRPGNRRAVHHALMGYETAGAAAALDAQTPEYGYESFGDFGVPTEDRFTGYTPGIQTVKLDHGIGQMLPAGSDLLIQVHYAPLPTDEYDQSSVNIFYKKEPLTRPLKGSAILPLFLPGGWGSFVIPANEVKTFHGTRFIQNDISLVSVYPHCHLLGKSWEIYATTPTGDTVNIIKIEDWDFNWQGAYTFDKLKKIPAGSNIHFIATYDNTVDNPFNPSNPPIDVAWGEKTTDEMYLAGYRFVDYQPGDEDIQLGTQIVSTEENFLTTANKLYPPYPNPSANEVMLGFALSKSQNISIQIYDLKGQVVKSLKENTFLPAGLHREKFELKEISSGQYFIQLDGADFQLSKKLIIK